MRTKLVAIPALVLSVSILSACGGGGQESSSEQPAATSGGARTVSIATVDGADVLVDSAGTALYTSEQEAGGEVRCTQSCAAIWLPLTLPSGSGTPTAGPALDGRLGVTTRPGGMTQVTFDGKPLYRFANDSGPDVVTGDGLTDSFGGVELTWHVAHPDQSSEPAPSSSGTRGY